MTDVSVDKDELVLLSPVWCVALKIDIGEAGVLVKPDEVKDFLKKAFVTERGEWHGSRRAICAEFEIPEMHEDPYPALIAQRGPALMSLRKICDPAGDEDLRVSAQNPQATKEYAGFTVYRAKKMTVTSQVDLKQVVAYVYASLKAAMDQRTKGSETTEAETENTQKDQSL